MRRVADLPDSYIVGWFKALRGLKSTPNHVFDMGDLGGELIPLCGRRFVDRSTRFEPVGPPSPDHPVVIDCPKCAELVSLSPLEWLARAAGETRRRVPRSKGRKAV